MKIEIRLDGKLIPVKEATLSKDDIDTIVDKVHLLDRRRSKDKIRNQSAWVIPLRDDTLDYCIKTLKKIRKNEKRS